MKAAILRVSPERWQHPRTNWCPDKPTPRTNRRPGQTDSSGRGRPIQLTRMPAAAPGLRSAAGVARSSVPVLPALASPLAAACGSGVPAGLAAQHACSARPPERAVASRAGPTGQPMFVSDRSSRPPAASASCPETSAWLQPTDLGSGDGEGSLQIVLRRFFHHHWRFLRRRRPAHRLVRGGGCKLSVAGSGAANQSVEVYPQPTGRPSYLPHRLPSHFPHREHSLFPHRGREPRRADWNRASPLVKIAKLP